MIVGIFVKIRHMLPSLNSLHSYWPLYVFLTDFLNFGSYVICPLEVGPILGEQTQVQMNVFVGSFILKFYYSAVNFRVSYHIIYTVPIPPPCLLYNTLL